MQPSGLQSHEDARRRLLEEGARSYLEAVTALIAYQREVQKKCREVMETNLEEYASALKVQLTSSEIQDAAWPSFAKWEGDWWYLGVQIVRKDIPNIRCWESQCYLQYESSDHKLFCCIGEWFPNIKMAADVFGQFHQLNRNVIGDGKYVWLEQILKVEEVAEFENNLEALFQQWIKLWQTVGGIKDIFRGA